MKAAEGREEDARALIVSSPERVNAERELAGEELKLM